MSNRSPALPFVIPTEPRISYYAAPPMTAYAAFRKESRMKFANATKPDRKSRGKWRDLQFSSLRAPRPSARRAIHQVVLFAQPDNPIPGRS
jgi:hypothetical protein